MGFLFTEDNQNLQKLKDEWIMGDSFGAYMLIGKSGSGKTAFLQHLDREWQGISQEKKITWMRVEELVAALLGDRDVFADVQTPVLIIENMEELIGKDNTLSLFWGALETWLHDKKRLFIGVTNNQNINIPCNVEVIYNHGIEITPMVVSCMAKMQDIHLEEERITSLCMESDGSISKLIGLVKRERLFV